MTADSQRRTPCCMLLPPQRPPLGPACPPKVVKSSKPDGFTPTIIKQTDDYLYAEFEVRQC